MAALGRSLFMESLVETYGERPARMMHSIDPTALFAESLSGVAFEACIMHTPAPHSVRRLFLDPADIRLEDGRIVCEDGDVRVSARRRSGEDSVGFGVHRLRSFLFVGVVHERAAAGRR